MPTKTGVATALFAALGLAIGRVFGIFEMYILAAAMLALVVCACVWVLVNRRSLQVTRLATPARLHAGGTSTVTLGLSNERWLPTPVARITDHVEDEVRADANVPPIRRGGSTRASYRLPTTNRGRIDIGPMKTKVTDPFGLASSTRTSAPDTAVLVLPSVDIIAPPPQPGGKTAHEIDRSPNRVGPNGDEFSALRAYAIGDDLRKVHWPSSARRGDLVVRTEHVPEHGHSLVLLDVRTGASDSATFELMVSAAASIVLACEQRGDHMRLVTTAGVDMSADNSRGYQQIMDELALVQQTKSASFSLPVRLGRAGDEAGAMILAGDAETLIKALPMRSGANHGPYIVRFQTGGAKATPASGRLPSGRMIDVEHGGDFATNWGRVLGHRVPRPAASPSAAR